MDGVTDASFRYMVAKYGKPGVIFTEFVSVDGMKYGGERVFYPFIHSSIERPVVAQVYGIEPELFYQAAVVVTALGFDGIDINMGCPAKKVTHRGAGAGMINTPDNAQEVVRATRRGIKDYVEGRVDIEDLDIKEEGKRWINVRVVKEKREIPVSVKTRIGVDEDVSEWWMSVLMEVELVVVSLHGRTLKQMYMGRADWDAIARAGEVVRKAGGMLLGNGDVLDIGDAIDKVRLYGVDGVLIGRGSFGNPMVFKGKEPDKATRLGWMIEHARKYEELLVGDRFFPMRKHLSWYAKGFPGASKMRRELMGCESASDVERVISGIV